MNMLLNKVYSLMFATNSSILPNFQTLDHANLILDTEIENKLSQFFSTMNIDINTIEINDCLKQFRLTFPDEANTLINYALEYYFSHPQVLASIQNGREALYPNHRPLHDIDYDLLIPVIEKESDS